MAKTLATTKCKAKSANRKTAALEAAVSDSEIGP